MRLLILIFIFLFIFFLSNLKAAKNLFPEPQNVKLLSGKVIQLDRQSNKVKGFWVEYKDKRPFKKYIKCWKINLYRLSYKGDLEMKKKASCYELKEGLPIEIQFVNNEPKTIFLLETKKHVSMIP